MLKQFRVFFIPLILQFAVVKVYGQGIIVTGGFLKDSVEIGEPVNYFLTAKYPSDFTILFPDSTFTFGPFEFVRKQYWPTRTIANLSYDSGVFTLATFEIDDVQFLRLPVYIVTKRDCTIVAPARDSVVLISSVSTPPPDTVMAQDLPLKTNTAYEKVFFLFNYPILLAFIISVVILAVLIWIFLGKKIKRHFKLKRLHKDHNRFIETFSGNLEELKQLFSAQRTENTLSIWKKYLEQLEKKPFTKLTTRETINLENDERLGVSLQVIDKAIYGHDTAVIESLEDLKNIARARFERKIEEVKHG